MQSTSGSKNSLARSRLAATTSSPNASRSHNRTSLTQRYLRHLPTALLSLPFWAASAWMVWRVSPATLQNWGWPNSYLPLVLSVWLALVWSGSFAFLKTRRGVTVASWLVVLLWSRLLQLEFEAWWFLSWTGVCWGLLAFLEVLERLTATHFKSRS